MVNGSSTPTHHQTCSLCTLGSKSQWTQVYLVTLTSACALYVCRNIIDFFVLKNKHSIDINLVISFFSMIASWILIYKTSVDESNCNTEDEIKIGKFHENASFLLISLFLGCFSLVSAIYSPNHNFNVPFFTIFVISLFCLIFLISSVVTRKKSLAVCKNFSLSKTFISNTKSSSSSSVYNCTTNLVSTCSKSDAIKCRDKMKKNNHKSFSIEYSPSYRSEWKLLPGKPNWPNQITGDIISVLYTFYTSPFQIKLTQSLSYATHHINAYSMVEWEERSPLSNYTDLGIDLSDTQKNALINKLNDNGGILSHDDIDDVKNFITTPPYFLGTWHQKEINYIFINIGNNSTLLQKVDTISNNSSLITTISINNDILAHHNNIITNKKIKLGSSELYGLTSEAIESTNYNNPTEASAIEKIQNIEFKEDSFVELNIGGKIYLGQVQQQTSKTLAYCKTYNKIPTSTEIIALASSDTTNPDNFCTNRTKHENIYYEIDSKSASNRTFLLNLSLTSLFASISLLRPILNSFSFLAFLQIIVFFFVAIGYYGEEKMFEENAKLDSDTWFGKDSKEELFWILIALLLLTTFSIYVYHSLGSKSLQAITLKSLSAISAILFNVFLLCHLVVQMSENPGRESVWFWLSFSFLIFFLFIPFNVREEVNTANYFAMILSTLHIRFFVLFAFVICTSVFSNNYLEIGREIRLFFVILIAIILGFMTFPKFKYDTLISSKTKFYTSALMSVIISIFITLNNFLQSFSNSTSNFESQESANKINLYNSSSALVVNLVTLVTTQLILGEHFFYPISILCVIPFLTLYQYKSVKQSTVESCSVNVSFENQIQTFNLNDCGDGSILTPSNNCRFSRIKATELEMLDTSRTCKVILYDEINHENWHAKKNIKFNEKCATSSSSSPSSSSSSCKQTFDQPTYVSAVTVTESCGLKIKFASQINSDTNENIPIGYYLRIKRNKIGNKGLRIYFENDQSDFEAVTENEDGSVNVLDISPSQWKNLKVNQIEISGNNYTIIAYAQEESHGLGLHWRKAGSEPPSGYVEFINSTLSTALSSKTTFTNDEWIEFNITNPINETNYVKSGDEYYVPVVYKNWSGPRTEYKNKVNEVSPPMKFNSILIKENDEIPFWTEILPFMMINIDGTFINILWRIVIYLDILLIIYSIISKQTQYIYFLVAFLIASLIGVTTKQNTFDNALGLGEIGLTKSTQGSMSPNLLGNIITIALFFALTVQKSFDSTGYERITMIIPSILFILLIIFSSTSTLPVIIICGITGALLIPSVQGKDKLFAICISLVAVISIITSWVMGRGIICNNYLLSSTGEFEYGNCEVPSGEFWKDFYRENKNFFLQIGYGIESVGIKIMPVIFSETEKTFTEIKEETTKGITDIGKETENAVQVFSKTDKVFSETVKLLSETDDAFFEIGKFFSDKVFFETGEVVVESSKSIVAKLQDDETRAYCDSNDKNNPLCIASKRNNCQFSYCISPPDPVRMSNFVNTPDIDRVQQSRCNAHRLFHTSALKAISEKRASSKEHYCVQYHKNDDCSNICDKYWKNNSDPVSDVTLAKLESRLKTIDDSVLNLSPEEWVQMRKENLV